MIKAKKRPTQEEELRQENERLRSERDRMARVNELLGLECRALKRNLAWERRRERGMAWRACEPLRRSIEALYMPSECRTEALKRLGECAEQLERCTLRVWGQPQPAEAAEELEELRRLVRRCCMDRAKSGEA